MHGVLIAFDIESTGLDVNNDEIIEIGAVKLKEGEVIDKYSSLVKPSIPIPADITHLTGIHPDDVQNAPPLSRILPTLQAFIGDAPVIAHNAAFDVSFLRRYGLLEKNLALDTYELSSIIIPIAPRYNLNSLTTHLGIELEQAHRALDDALATAYLYWELWKKLLNIPYSLIAEIVQASENIQWDSRDFFRAALHEIQTSNPAGFQAIPITFKPLEQDLEALKTSDAQRQTVELSQIDAILGEHGTLSQQIENYEHRPQQIEMAYAVTNALNKGEHIMIEAGTGTGKSLAYLVPSVLWSTLNSQRVVIATNTINLQDQLLKHDIPLVINAVDKSFRTSVMKGRGNYLCPRRLETMRRRKPSNIDELRTLAKILIWMQESQSGDRGEITLRAGEYAIWSRLSAQDEGCTTHRCSTIMHGVCPFYKARKQAEASHVIIANHALIISDALSENRVLPEYLNLIVDEAHQLEDAITSGLSVRIEQLTILRRLSELGSPNSGLLGEFLSAARKDVPAKQVLKLEAFIQNISDALRLMASHVRTYFNALHDFLMNTDNNVTYQFRIISQHRDSGRFASVQMAWGQLNEFFQAVIEAIQQLSSALSRFEEYKLANFDEFENGIRSHHVFISETRLYLHQFTQEPDNNTVYSLSPGDVPDDIRIYLAPLHVGPMMEEHIIQRKESVVLTSATMRTQANFEHIRERLYAEDFKTMNTGSPFNYKDSTLLYVPDDIPEPNQNNYQRMVERGIIELAAALDGRVLVLFTSYSQLRETSKAITPRLTLGNIAVYDQSFGTSRETLLESFKTTEKAVLMGTRSFWQGVDIPGDDLSAVIIARLPFAVPSDPIFASRSETYNNAFKEYAIPDAILRFRQGFGRLIRSQNDRGIVTIFDSRIINKNYGQNFLESLPDCTVQYGPLQGLAPASVDWLNKKK